MEENAPLPSATPAPSRRRWWRPLLLLIIVALLGAGGWLLWQYQQSLVDSIATQQSLTQRLAREVAALDGRATRTETRQGDLATGSQRNRAEIADFGRRIDEHDQIVGRLNEQIAGGHQRFQLAAVEQLLLLANDRALLAHDARSALVALDAADQRLAALADPRLFNVRSALAQERAALAAVPQPDLAGATLSLASLIDRVPRLPLAARVPERFEAPAADGGVQAPPGASWWVRTRTSILRALRGTFSVRRNRGPVPQLLAPEQETLVYQVLTLKLEGARVALLRGDSAAFRDLAESSRRWIGDYFRKDDPGVLAAQAELERLQPLDLQPPLPDLSRSLALLRAQLEPADR